jgi:hypothetical protein
LRRLWGFKVNNIVSFDSGVLHKVPFIKCSFRIPVLKTHAKGDPWYFTGLWRGCGLTFLFFAPCSSFRIANGFFVLAKDEDGISVHIFTKKLTVVYISATKNTLKKWHSFQMSCKSPHQCHVTTPHTRARTHTHIHIHINIYIYIYILKALKNDKNKRATPSVGLRVAEPPSWALGVVQPLSKTKPHNIFFSSLFGHWGWFGNSQWPNPLFFFFCFFPWRWPNHIPIWATGVVRPPPRAKPP